MPVHFEDYLDAVKAYLPTAKKGNRSRLLQNVTTATLRNFYIHLIKEGLNKNDDESLRCFFDIKQDDDLIKEAKKETEKLKSVKRFIDGVTETPTQDTLEMIAIILDFNPRPYSRFYRAHGVVHKNEAEEPTAGIDTSNSVNVQPPEKEEEKEPSGRGIPIITDQEAYAQADKRKWFTRRNIAAGVVGVLLITMSAYGVKEKFFEKECMQWQESYFKVMDCESEINNFMNTNPIIAYDKNLAGMKRVFPCDTTRFFNDHDKPLVWYQKKNNKIELFNMCGLHPVTGNTLKPITPTIINNHLRPLKSCK